MATKTTAAAADTSIATLRNAYTFIFNEFAVDYDQVAAYCQVNRRPAREIVATLQGLGIVGVDHVNGNMSNAGIAIQSNLTYDDIDLDEALANFDAAIAAKFTGMVDQVAEVTRTVKVRGAVIESALCGCNCGLFTNKNRSYKPGHDARHASQVAKGLALLPEGNDFAYGGLLGTLPTPALRNKAILQAARLRAANA